MPLLLSIVIALTCTASAASRADEAERDRLGAEMEVLAGRQQWNGVEQQYQRLTELVPLGVVLDAELHMLGVEAARASGRIGDALERLERAIQAGAPTAARQRAELLGEFGRVQLELGARPSGDWTLEQVPAPFAPVARASIERADAALHERKRYTGFLPAGSYRIGERRFEVAAGDALVIIAISGSPSDHGEPQRTSREPAPPRRSPETRKERTSRTADEATGARVFARVGAGLGGVTAPPEGVVAPPPGVGLSPVVGVGHAWKRGDVQVAGLLAGRALFAGAGTGGQQLYLASAGLLLGWHLDGVRLEAGPLYAAGGGRSTGVATTADPQACAAGACGSEQARGTTFGPGVELGSSVPLFRNDRSTGSLDIHGGAFTDGTRTLPWLTVALALSPGARPSPGDRK